jgi:hypothetical protein
MRTIQILSAVGLVVLAGNLVAPPQVQAQEEVPKDIIATQIRKQGFACEKPQNAVLDKEASKPDEPEWILTCESARYRVRMIPDQAAQVEVLGE